MTHLVHVRTGCAPPPARLPLARWVCTNNPLYVVSAGLFLAGLWITFVEPAQALEAPRDDTWALMSWLAGYTLLLAGTAYLLVRFADVWDDVRTVLLLVVLMFLATSVTFDEVLVQTPWRGLTCYVGGLGFAIAVSEGLLRGIGLSLPAWFRGPYHLILALFFLYPLALTPLVRDQHNEAHMWALFAFSATAGLVFLTLLPAIRRGAAYVRRNGSPWTWPFYPWTLFAMLGLAVPARAFLLCYSMHQPEGGFRGQVIFGPFFLVPFGLALAVLLLEIGLVCRSRGLLGTALCVPVVLCVLASAGHRFEPMYQEFLAMFMRRLGGTPLFLTLGAAAAFYGYAAWRGVPLATGAMTTALAGLAFVGPTTLDLDALTFPHPTPLLMAAALQIGLGIRHRDWRHGLAGGLLTILALSLPGPYRSAGGRGYVLLRDLVLGLHYITLSLIVFFLAVVVSVGKSSLRMRRLAARHKQLELLMDRKGEGTSALDPRRAAQLEACRHAVARHEDTGSER